MTLLAFVVVPPSRPDFSGLWRLNLEQSTLRGAAPRELLVRIQHREPTLIQTVLVVSVDGGEQQQTFRFDTTGGESTNAMSSGEGRTRARWNGSELVIESVLSTPNRTFHFSDHWSLSADGEALRMAHLDDDLAGQIAVLEKAPAEVAERFKPE